MAIFHLLFKLFIIFFLHYISVIFKKREPLIKLFYTAFVCCNLRCKMSGVILKCAKKAFERGVIKKFAMIVSYEGTGIFSSDFRHSYKSVWRLFSKNKETVKWISTIVMHVMLHFEVQTVSVWARNPPLSICLQHLIIYFICDVYRAYPWGNFTNYTYIFSISLANDFLLTIAIWPPVGYNCPSPDFTQEEIFRTHVSFEWHTKPQS